MYRAAAQPAPSFFSSVWAYLDKPDVEASLGFSRPIFFRGAVYGAGAPAWEIASRLFKLLAEIPVAFGCVRGACFFKLSSSGGYQPSHIYFLSCRVWHEKIM